MNLNYSNHQGKNILFMNAENPGKSCYGSIFCSKAPFKPFKGTPASRPPPGAGEARCQRTAVPAPPHRHHFTGLLCKLKLGGNSTGENAAIQSKLCPEKKNFFWPDLSDLSALKLEDSLFLQVRTFWQCTENSGCW